VLAEVRINGVPFAELRIESQILRPSLNVMTLPRDLAIGSVAAGAALDAFGKTAVFGWRPTEAYLTGKKKKEEKKKEDK